MGSFNKTTNSHLKTELGLVFGSMSVCGFEHGLGCSVAQGYQSLGAAITRGCEPNRVLCTNNTIPNHWAISAVTNRDFELVLTQYF